MLKRLVVGLVLGLVIGGLFAAGVVAGLHMTVVPAWFAYALAAVTGVVTGLVAGKPIWAKGGQIEAGLKAFFGALLGVGLMFAVRTWVNPVVDLSFIEPHLTGRLGDLPVSLALIAAVLGGFYELDNTPAPSEDDKAGKSGKAAPKSKKNVRVAEKAVDGEEEEEAAPTSKKMKR
jgi:hypothetical protein